MTPPKAGAGRVPSAKLEYRPPRFEMVQTARGMRRVPKDNCWRSRLNQIVDLKGGFKQDGLTPTAYKTRDNVRRGLNRMFEVLHKEFPFEDPQRFDYRHLLFLEAWMQQLYDDGVAGKEPSLSADTIGQYTTYLRNFCRWIRQPLLESMVGKSYTSSDTVARTSVATEDRSWEGRGIDVAAKIDQAWDIEPWVGMALFAQAAFGLRKKESICLAPATAYNGFVLFVNEGTKGGRPRHIPLWEEAQFQAVGVLMTWLAEEHRPKSAIGAGCGTLKQNLRRYQHVLETIGVTKLLTGASGHGLRTGFACRLLAAYGVTAPVRGGDVASMDRAKARKAYTIGTEAMGHSRTTVMNAYGGSTRSPRPEIVFKDCVPPDLDDIVRRMSAHRKETWLDRRSGRSD